MQSKIDTLLTFQQLWDKANTVNKSSNGLYYHPCCDTWTTRSSKAKRASHIKHLQWNKIISTLGRSNEDKKQALLAKMIEESWRLDIVFNEYCQFKSTDSIKDKSPFKRKNIHLASEDLQAKSAQQELILPSPDYPIYEDQCIFYFISSSRTFKYQYSRANSTNSNYTSSQRPLSNRVLFCSLSLNQRVESLEKNQSSELLSLKADVQKILQSLADIQPPKVVLSEKMLRRLNYSEFDTKLDISMINTQLSKQEII